MSTESFTFVMAVAISGSALSGWLSVLGENIMLQLARSPGRLASPHFKHKTSHQRLGGLPGYVALFYKHNTQGAGERVP